MLRGRPVAYQNNVTRARRAMRDLEKKGLAMGIDAGPPPEEPPPWLDEDSYGDPWPEDGYGEAPAQPVGASPPGARTGRGRSDLDVVGVLREIVASQQGAPVEECLEVVRMISASDVVLAALAEAERRSWDSILEVLESDCINRIGGSVNLGHMPLVRQYDEEVNAEFAKIVDLALAPDGCPLKDGAMATWFALVESVQRLRAKRTTKRYLSALDDKRPPTELVELFHKIEPPTTRKALSSTRPLRTARQVLAEHQASTSGGSGAQMRLSSGLPTFDVAFTNTGEALGSIAPGEQLVVAGLTGTGKTSFFYTIVPAMTQDLVNWGLRDAKVVAFHTEEESVTKIRGAGFADGQKFHHLADNLIVVDIGSSRKRIVETLYDLVVEANRQAIETGRPIRQFLPYAVLLDYIQAVIEPEDRDVTQATFTTAELLMRGVQKWDPEELAKFGGLDFRTYAGMAWPAGMEDHRVAVVTFAQLVKQDDKTMFYKVGSKMPISDFTLEYTGDGEAPWVDTTGGRWCWEVRDGDLRLLGKNAIRGHGQILQNATVIVFLHRSRPEHNPAVDSPDGTKHLVDTRARLLLEKTRQGSRLLYVPLAFDLDAAGFRARFYDKVAEQAVGLGKLKLDPIYSRYGDPMLPVRPLARPLAGLRY